MAVRRRFAQWLRFPQAGIALSILASLGVVLLSGLMLFDLRHVAWEKAEQTSKNLLQVIERDIARNIEIIDLTLRAVIDNLKAPGVAEASPELRQLILFDRAATARDMGVMLVLDENGNSIIDAGMVPARPVNYSDREYFHAHKERSDIGLHISRPLVSRLTGTRMIALSRRINKPDGSFGGVVLATLHLSYFNGLFKHIALGANGAINVYLNDGTRIMRYPYAEADIGVNIARSENFDRFLREGNGGFTGTSTRDGMERYFNFTGIGDLPMILNVALSVDEVEADWRTKATIIGITVLALCGVIISLSLLFARELRGRAAAQGELALLSRTDSLTGLPNRRQFEEASARAWKSAARMGKPLSLLLVDADHLKRYNDWYGHTVGDEVLKGLAQALSASVHRPNDIVCRVGGEEFVLLLPDTDRTGALRIAERVHEEVSRVTACSVGLGVGSITVSVGLASTVPSENGVTTVTNLYERANAALYEAQAEGRNQTRCAASDSDIANARKKMVLRMVEAS
jgi:diguanylate cyclase (GGDEF)-like protein